MALLLSACSTIPSTPLISQDVPEEIPPEEQASRWHEHQQYVANVSEWSLIGRIAVNTEDDGWSGDLNWAQHQRDYLIQFSAPFGQGAFQLDRSVNGVEMRFSDGQIFRAPDAESLLFQQLGWHLPLTELRYWVTGVPQPMSDANITHNPFGQLAELKQGQWQVSYSDYFAVGKVMMPKKVIVKNHQLSVRLVIDGWSLGAEMITPDLDLDSVYD